MSVMNSILRWMILSFSSASYILQRNIVSHIVTKRVLDYISINADFGLNNERGGWGEEKEHISIQLFVSDILWRWGSWLFLSNDWVVLELHEFNKGDDAFFSSHLIHHCQFFLYVHLVYVNICTDVPKWENIRKMFEYKQWNIGKRTCKEEQQKKQAVIENRNQISRGWIYSSRIPRAVPNNSTAV